MKIAAVRLTQAGRKLYIAAMTAEELLLCGETTEWDPGIGWTNLSAQGYQRAPVAKHFQAIGRFLASGQNVFMPTNALLSAREDEYGVVPFKGQTKLGSIEIGELDLTNRTLYIVDYQHRWRGLEYAINELHANHLRAFTIPVTIIGNMPHAEEIEQFFLINSKQRRIDTDLALALLQTLGSELSEDDLVNLVGPGKRYRIRATRLTFRFAERGTAAWGGKIAQPHDIPTPGEVIKLKSFVDSLKPLLSTRSPISRLPDEELLDVIEAYWTALSQLIPNAFSAAASHQVQRTVGTFAFHLLLARTVYPLALDAGEVTTAGFKKILSKIDSSLMDQAFWMTGGPATLYTGGSGQLGLWKRLANGL